MRNCNINFNFKGKKSWPEARFSLFFQMYSRLGCFALGYNHISDFFQLSKFDLVTWSAFSFIKVLIMKGIFVYIASFNHFSSRSNFQMIEGIFNLLKNFSTAMILASQSILVNQQVIEAMLPESYLHHISNFSRFSFSFRWGICYHRKTDPNMTMDHQDMEEPPREEEVIHQYMELILLFLVTVEVTHSSTIIQL